MADPAANPTAITAVRWTLEADPKDMEAAEAEVLGSYANHMSSPEFGFPDHDDDPPEMVARTVTLYQRDLRESPERVTAFWRLAAALGDKGMVCVKIETPAVTAYVDSRDSKQQRVTVDAKVFAEALNERIRRAHRVLDGRDE